MLRGCTVKPEGRAGLMPDARATGSNVAIVIENIIFFMSSLRPYPVEFEL